MTASLYESFSVDRPDITARGRTEGTKTQETLDRDRDSVSLEPARTEGTRGERLGASLYRTLDDPAGENLAPGETKKTSAKETVDDDAEALLLDLKHGGLDTLYCWLSVPASNASAPERTESTRDAHETLDNDRESDSLGPLLSLG